MNEENKEQQILTEAEELEINAWVDDFINNHKEMMDKLGE